MLLCSEFDIEKEYSRGKDCYRIKGFNVSESIVIIEKPILL